MPFEKEFARAASIIGILGSNLLRTGDASAILNESYLTAYEVVPYQKLINFHELPENRDAYLFRPCNENRFRLEIALDKIKMPKIFGEESIPITELTKAIVSRSYQILKILHPRLQALEDRYVTLRDLARKRLDGLEKHPEDDPKGEKLQQSLKEAHEKWDKMNLVYTFLANLSAGGRPRGGMVQLLKDFKKSLFIDGPRQRLLKSGDQNLVTAIGNILELVQQRETLYEHDTLESTVNFHEDDAPSETAGSSNPDAAFALDTSKDIAQQMEQHHTRQMQHAFRKYLTSIKGQHAELGRVLENQSQHDKALAVLKGKETELSGVIENQSQHEMAEQEKHKILDNDKLSDYYYIFQLTFNDVLLASKTIHSGMVANASRSKANVASDIIKEVGKHIPVASIFIDIFAGALNAYGDHKKAEAVNRVARFLPGALSCEVMGELLARALTLAQIKEIQELPSDKNTGFFKKHFAKLKDKIMVNDIDTPAKKMAHKHCQLLLTAIMEDKLKAHPDTSNPEEIQTLLRVMLGNDFVYSATVAKPRTISQKPAGTQKSSTPATTPSVDLVQRTDSLAEQLRLQEEAHQKQLRQIADENAAREKQFQRQMEEMMKEFQKFSSMMAGGNGNQALALATPFATNTATAQSQDSLALLDHRVKTLEQGQMVLNQAVLRENGSVPVTAGTSVADTLEAQSVRNRLFS